jgi:hypothetical protein
VAGGVAEDLILPVPDGLSAAYLVPAPPTGPDPEPRSGADLKERLGALLAARLAGPAGAAAEMMLAAGAVTAEALPSSSMPPLPAWLQNHLGVPAELIRSVEQASELVLIQAAAEPGWPPMHEWAGRACAAVLAEQTGVPLVDAFTPKVMAADAALRTLPAGHEPGGFRLAEWMLVFSSPASAGLWLTTSGLGRFGLPELQVRNVPPQMGKAWMTTLTGVASCLLGAWQTALRDRADGAFARFPALLEVSQDDVARAYGTAAKTGPKTGQSAAVRLSYDPSPEEGVGTFLSVRPPDDYPASAGEFLAGVCAALFGPAEQEVRYLAPSQEMEQAMRSARETLPAARTRFLAGDLPSHGQLMVKHKISAPGQVEYPWAYVTSWTDPDKVLGNSAADATLDPGIRAGRPIVVDAGAVIDWAIWIDGQGIVEGGRTNVIAREGQA